MKVSKVDGTASDGGPLVAAITHLDNGKVQLDRADGTVTVIDAADLEIVELELVATTTA